MHAPRRLTLVIAVAVACLALPAAAAAAAGDRVLADWRVEGTIDGTYTLAELRAADAQINPQEREYTFWDDEYAAAVRRLNDPDAPAAPKRPPTVPAQDFDGDGVIDAKDIATAKDKTKALRAKLRRCKSAIVAKRPKDCPDKPVQAEETDDDKPAASKKDDDNDDGGIGALIALLFVVPAAIIGFGAWRMQRRRASDNAAQDEDGPSASSFTGDGD